MIRTAIDRMVIQATKYIAAAIILAMTATILYTIDVYFLVAFFFIAGAISVFVFLEGQPRLKEGDIDRSRILICPHNHTYIGHSKDDPCFVCTAISSFNALDW